MNELLNGLLCEWHRWATGFQPVAAFGHCPMWSNNLSSRQWDSASEVLDGSLHNDQMKCVDFEIDQLSPVFRTALQLQARNLSTGWSVWRSPRLPQDPVARGHLMAEAREAILVRLEQAGII